MLHRAVSALSIGHPAASPYRNCGHHARGFRTLKHRGHTSYIDAVGVEPAGSSMYRSTTRGIEVQVTPRFLSERSSPDNGYYFWAYTIEITNRGPITVQLKTRHWKITDAHGKLQEVRGAGVVGE